MGGRTPRCGQLVVSVSAIAWCGWSVFECVFWDLRSVGVIAFVVVLSTEGGPVDGSKGA